MSPDKGEKGVRNLLPERPSGCSAQKVPDPFFSGSLPLAISDHELGLDFYLEVGGGVGPQAVKRLVAESAKELRGRLAELGRGAQPGPARSARLDAFLAALLAIDRAGFLPGTLSVLPAEPGCQPGAHARGEGCPLCAVLELIAEAEAAKLIRVLRIAGDKDRQGRYVSATDIAIEPGEALPGYRARLAPPAEPPAPEPDQATTLAGLRAGSWAEIVFEVSSEGFRVGNVSGVPADLDLEPGEWELFRDFAKGLGEYRSAGMGGADAQLAGQVERLGAALKRAFPQVPGEPIRSVGSGSYNSAFRIRPD